MRALCRLSAGLSHEMNSLLGVINSNASELISDRELTESSRLQAQRIGVAGERAASLTRQLLLFSGQHPCWSRPIEFGAWLNDSRSIWERMLGPEIELQINDVDRPIGISGDSELLIQMISSLAANAVDAIHGRGKLVISTSIVAPSELPDKQQPGGERTDCVCLQVSDTGEGIPRAVLPHIFVPFFTTRAVKARLGLGLSVVKGIVDSHGGFVEVHSQPQGGTTVEILLPLVEAKGEAPTEPSMPSAPVPHETILLVEDDDLLRETTAEVMCRAGYRVLQTDSGESARETWQWHADRVQLLFTDVVLPRGESGLDIAADFYADNPALKIICTSGFSHEIMQRLGDLPKGWMYLPKPCLPPAMLKTIRSILDQPAV